MTLRRAGALAVIAATLLAVAACAGPRRERDNGVVVPDGPGGRMMMIRPGQDPNTLYAEGLDLKSRGDCAAAVPKLRLAANMGPGYANAQTALGECLVAIGSKDKDLSSDYLDGMTWLRRAADSGWPEAQGVLAKAHLYGPAAIRNGEEAAYWLTLYEVNQGKVRVGFVPISDAEVAKMERALSPEDRAAGVKRAQRWQRQIWLPPTPQPGAEEGAGPGPQGGQRRRGPSR